MAASGKAASAAPSQPSAQGASSLQSALGEIKDLGGQVKLGSDQLPELVEAPVKLLDQLRGPLVKLLDQLRLPLVLTVSAVGGVLVIAFLRSLVGGAKKVVEPVLGRIPEPPDDLDLEPVPIPAIAVDGPFPGQ